MDDIEYMRMALALAARGAGRVAPNPMVGAVVVKDRKVVGQGYHQAVGGPHAEVRALDDAGERSQGATLYVTLEPCHHQGRTPPCTDRICRAGIERVVVAMRDPNPHVRGGGNAFLRTQGIKVECGLCVEEAVRLNESFVQYTRTQKPFVVLKLAATLDGRIATRTGDARWVTGPQARTKVHLMRHQMDAIMVGSGTVAADDPRLTARLDNGTGVDPARVILDTHLRLPADRRIFNPASPAPTVLVCGPDPNTETRERMEGLGVKVVPTALTAEGRIDLSALMGTLGQMGITSLLIEGGGRVAGSALNEGVVDKIVFFYAPKILGGDDGFPMLRGSGPEAMEAAQTISGMRVETVGDDIMVEGYLHPLQPIDFID